MKSCKRRKIEKRGKNVWTINVVVEVDHEGDGERLAALPIGVFLSITPSPSNQRERRKSSNNVFFYDQINPENSRWISMNSDFPYKNDD